MEYTNALQLKLFHQSATPAQVQAVAALVAADVKSGVLLPVVADWEKIFRAASDLARRHSAALGCRSLDVLHCATAMVVEASVFLTTDAKQKQLAAAMGLNLGVLE